MKMNHPESPDNMNQNCNQAEPEYTSYFLPSGVSKKQFNIINQCFNHRKNINGQIYNRQNEMYKISKPNV